MKKKYRYNLDEIRGMIAFEGLGYTVRKLTPSELIDTKLQHLWICARLALRDVEQYLKEDYK